MDRLHFLHPVRVGEIVVVKAEVSFAAHTSMEVEAEVLAENPRTGERAQATHAFVTFVALDEAGRPRPVPRLVTETAAERRRFKQAAARRAARLRERSELGRAGVHRK
jgi:acyl-CoA hydrolase